MTGTKEKLLGFVKPLEELRALIQVLEKDLREEVVFMEEIENETAVQRTSLREIRARKRRIKENADNLKKGIAALHGRMDGLVRELKESLPDVSLPEV